MNYIDEFRSRGLVRKVLGRCGELAGRINSEEINIMEICGTHTHSISKYGIRGSLPHKVRLISGPGCPVCVTSERDIDAAIDFIRSRDDVILATFGDMLRVPGTGSSLERERARGSKVRVVYSPLDALAMAKDNPDKEVVLFSVGFETTAPTVASTVLSAREEGIGNFSLFSLHKLTPPAMDALMASGEVRIDGFICPGHVTAIIGADAYGFLARKWGSPCVIAGFEPLDALFGICMLLEQFAEGRVDIEIEYDRVVTRDGNDTAKAVIGEVFTTVDGLWRGIGEIPSSALALNERFSEFDAIERFGIYGAAEEREPQTRGCVCGEVLRGLIPPSDCVHFAKGCTPESPLGPCMVSSEGTCAAYYKYERHEVA